MSTSIRTFIGIPVQPPQALTNLLEQFKQLGRGVKPVATETMHITLKFLGETPHDRIPQLTKLIADAVAGVKSRELPLRGLGAFPNTTRPAVAWAAIHEAEELVSIAARIDSFLEPEGFAREGRAYTPHLTLARVRALRDGSRERIPDGVLELLREHGATDFGSVPMNEVVFYKSTLSDSGPTYERLATFALDNSGRV